MRDDEDKLTNSDESFFMIMEFRDAGDVWQKPSRFLRDELWETWRKDVKKKTWIYEQLMKNNFQREIFFCHWWNASMPLC